MSIIFTKAQKNAIKKVSKWYKKIDEKQIFQISGYSGTGKSTIINACIDSLNLDMENNVRFITYTGKASLVLRRKGLPSSTIHKLIYDPKIVKKKVINEKGEEEYVEKIDFSKKNDIDKDIKLLVLDEASMINERLYDDLKSFNVPILVLGDPGQLDPIEGQQVLLKDPDIILTEILRQAEDNPIIYLSMLARTGQKIQPGKYGKGCYVIYKDQLNAEKIFPKVDIILCSKNITRDNINDFYRRDILGHTSFMPQINDKIICRRNNWDLMLNSSSTEINLPLINGLIGYIRKINLVSSKDKNQILIKEIFENEELINKSDSMKYIIDFQPEFLDNNVENYFTNITIDNKIFNLDIPYKERIKGIYNRKFNHDLNMFEYGYAITTHLSQGSEWEKILVYDEIIGDREFMKKLRYTAITRASKKLIYCI